MPCSKSLSRRGYCVGAAPRARRGVEQEIEQPCTEPRGGKPGDHAGYVTAAAEERELGCVTAALIRAQRQAIGEGGRGREGGRDDETPITRDGHRERRGTTVAPKEIGSGTGDDRKAVSWPWPGHGRCGVTRRDAACRAARCGAACADRSRSATNRARRESPSRTARRPASSWRAGPVYVNDRAVVLAPGSGAEIAPLQHVPRQSVVGLRHRVGRPGSGCRRHERQALPKLVAGPGEFRVALIHHGAGRHASH